MLCKIRFRSRAEGQERSVSWCPDAYCWHDTSSTSWLCVKASQAKNMVYSVTHHHQTQGEEESPQNTAIWVYPAFHHQSIHVAHGQAFIVCCTRKMQNVPNQSWSLDMQRCQTVNDCLNKLLGHWGCLGCEEMALSCIKGGLDWILGKILQGKGGRTLEQVAQGGGRVPVPGGV